MRFIGRAVRITTLLAVAAAAVLAISRGASRWGPARPAPMLPTAARHPPRVRSVSIHRFSVSDSARKGRPRARRHAQTRADTRRPTLTRADASRRVDRRSRSPGPPPADHAAETHASTRAFEAAPIAPAATPHPTPRVTHRQSDVSIPSEPQPRVWTENERTVRRSVGGSKPPPSFRWERAELSVPRTHAAAAGCGDVVVVAGGTLPGKSSTKGLASVDARVARAKPQTERALRNLLLGAKAVPTDAVDVYNASSNTWSTARMSSARTGAVAVATSRAVFIAGGEDAEGKPSATVDILHLDSSGDQPGGGTWTRTTMSKPRRDFAAAAVSWPGGDLVLFAGGSTVGSGTGGSLTATVDAYDARAGRWISPGAGYRLSRARKKLVGVGVGSKALFAGGQEPTDNDGDFSTRVDIFDAETGRWSRASLSGRGRMYVAAASAGGKAFFAGGNLGCAVKPASHGLGPGERMVSFSRAYARATPAARATCDGGTSDTVDVYDAKTNTWTVRRLSVPRAIVVGASAGEWASFAGGNGHAHATRLYALPGACTGAPPFPGGWQWRQRDNLKKWGAHAARTKEGRATLAMEAARARLQERACLAGPYQSVVGGDGQKTYL